MPQRLPVLVRQTKVFELVVAGKSYPEICRQLRISEDTVARDMRAVAEQVQELVRTRADEILAVAIAQIAEVRASAQREYEEDRKREKAWFAGKLDYPVVKTTAKTRQYAPRRRAKGDDAGQAKAGGDADLPLETTTETNTLRPPFQSNRAQYLALMLQATRDLVALTGVQKIILELQGNNGGPIDGRHLTDAERADRVAALLAAARARRAGAAA